MIVDQHGTPFPPEAFVPRPTFNQQYFAYEEIGFTVINSAPIYSFPLGHLTDEQIAELERLIEIENAKLEAEERVRSPN